MAAATPGQQNFLASWKLSSLIRSVNRIFNFAIDIGFDSNENSSQNIKQDDAISIKKRQNNVESYHLNIQDVKDNFPPTKIKSTQSTNDTKSREKNEHFIAKDFLMENGEWLETRLKFFQNDNSFSKFYNRGIKFFEFPTILPAYFLGHTISLEHHSRAEPSKTSKSIRGKKAKILRILWYDYTDRGFFSFIK